MSKKPRHRGPAPGDDRLFGTRMLPRLRQAAHDLGWLLDRDYALPSASELVGNRHALTARQRLAVNRCVCSQSARLRRAAHEVAPDTLRGRDLWIDGFNVLTAVEAALAGAFLLCGFDHCYRDLASLYARHHEVEETRPALELLGSVMNGFGVRCAHWWLDRPVSNSGRLRRRLLDLAAEHGWNWQADLVFNPDKVLAESEEVIATADSAILDRCARWLNLARHTIDPHLPHARVVDLAVRSVLAPDRPL